MSFRAALRDRLVAWPDLSAATIRWTVSGQRDGAVRIVLRVVSQPRTRHLRGFNGARLTRVQADCFAPDGETAEALAEAVLSAVAAAGLFGGVRMTLAEASGPIDLSEKTADGIIHRQTVDVTIWHNS